MNDEIPSHCLVNRLIHEKNMLIVNLISGISVKHKRKLFSLLRKEAPTHANYLFLQFSACTLSEFCLIHVLLSDGKRKFNDYIGKAVGKAKEKKTTTLNNKKQRSSVVRHTKHVFRL